MSTQYPNQYYAELAEMIVKAPSLAMLEGEVCFYEGKAKSYQVVTKIVEKPKTKTSFFWTPWVAGIKRKKEVEVKSEQETEYYKGTLYITNMRLVFKCKVDAFNLVIPKITSINQHRDGIRVVSGGASYDVMTSDVKRVLHIIDIMNKAFTEQENNSTATVENSPKTVASATANVSRNDEYATAAFIHYCEYSGQPIGKKSADYPNYFQYEYKVNNPAKYHQRVVDEGYLTEAPVSASLSRLKVDQLKKILLDNGLSDKGKKDALIQRIIDDVDLKTLDLEVLYVPSDKGWEYLKQYEYIFVVKKYDITPAEYEAKQAKLKSNRVNDVIWQILNDKFNEYSKEGILGWARNVLLKKAELLASEDKKADSLYYYILVLYYDMKNYASGSSSDAMLAPGIIKAIYEKQEFFTPEMIERCYQRYALPGHNMSKAKFSKLLQLIFEDETIDLATL